MKKTTILTSIIALCLAGGLAAQQGPRRDRTPPTPTEILERFDVNQDGVIELEEIETVTEQRRSQRQADRDQRRQNQSVENSSPKAQKGGQRPGQRRDPAMMAERAVNQFDSDGDELLSAEELQEFFATMQKRGGPKASRKNQTPPQNQQ